MSVFSIRSAVSTAPLISTASVDPRDAQREAAKQKALVAAEEYAAKVSQSQNGQPINGGKSFPTKWVVLGGVGLLGFFMLRKKKK